MHVPLFSIKPTTEKLTFQQPEMSPLAIFFSSLFSLLILYFTHKILSSKKNEGKRPPSPPKLPIIGNLHQLGSQPHRSLDALAKKHGPLMFLKLGSVPTIVVSSAEMAREVMKTQDHKFASRPSVEFGRQLVYNSTDVAFAPYSEYWRQAKKITDLHLLSAKKVQSFRPVREEEVALMVDKIANEFSSKGRAVNLSKMLNSLSNDIASRVTLGKKYYGEEENNTRFCEMIRENSALGGAFFVGDFFPRHGWLRKMSSVAARMRRHFKNWDEFLNQVIDDHLRNHSSRGESPDSKRVDDLVDVLLSLRHDASLTMDNVKALIQDMFVGGTDTSYVTMEWTMAELIRHPKTMKRVQEEIRTILDGKTAIEEEDISKMVYLKAIIKEVMRMHHPVPLLMPRESIEATSIEGYEIPARSRVIINAWAIGRNTESWDMPEKFFPERFLDSLVDYKSHDFHFIPFGAGRRSCPGMLFAISTIELALANLLFHFDWCLPGGKNPEELDMTEVYELISPMKFNLVVDATQHSVK